MQENQEKLIKQIYQKFRAGKAEEPLEHLDEEGFICFASGKLEREESLRVKEHLINCSNCADKFSIFLKFNDTAIINADQDFIERLENLVLADRKNMLEVFIKAKDYI